MSANRTRVRGQRVTVTITDGGVNAGDPALCSQLAGVVEGPKDANGNAVLIREGVFSLSVKGVNAGGNAVINQGDKIFYVVGDTPKLSAKIAGVFFGYAKGAQPTPPTALANPVVASGATSTIEVIVGGGSYS